MTSETHISETSPEFVARSRPRIWAVIVLALATALLVYGGWESLGPDFSVKGRGAFLNEAPPWLRGTFFFGIAAVCLGLGMLQLWRKLTPQIEVEADPQGITSHLLWGKGQLRWADIVALERKGNWLLVRGTGPNAKPKIPTSMNEIVGASRDPARSSQSGRRRCR